MRQKLLHEGKNLRRQGTIIDCSNSKCGDLGSITMQIGLTREEVTEAGFVILRNATFKPAPGVLYERIHGEAYGQHLHHDTLPFERENFPLLVFLHHDIQDRPRRAWTVVGDEQQVYDSLIEHIKNNGALPYKNLPVGYSFLQLSTYRTYPQNKDFFFNSLYSQRNAFVAPKTIREVYGACEKVCYYHTWTPGDILLIDDEKMVHGRLPFPDAQFSAATSIIAKTYNWISSKRLVPSTLFV